MPVAPVRYAANQFGLPGVVGLNDQIGMFAVNNSGAALATGDVVVYDTTTSVNTTNTTTVSGAQTITQASQTLTVAATGGFPAGPAPLLVMMTLVTGGTPVPVFGFYNAIGTGTTFTGFTSQYASIANGAANGAAISVPPNPPAGSTVFSYLVTAGMTAAPGDGGRYVTLVGVANNANVAGVVSVDATAGTAIQGPMSTAYNLIAGYGVAAGPAVIPPGGDCYIVTSGVARVNIGANTIAAGNLLCTSTVPGVAFTTGAIGNLLGVALEAQTAKDVNNTIRCRISV